MNSTEMGITMKKSICIMLCLTVIIASLAGCDSRQKNIRFGSADIGGMYYSFASSFTGIAAKDKPDMTFEVKNTAGSAANIRLLSGKYIELGIAQADLIQDAYNGSGSFDGTRYKGYGAVAALYTEACQIIVGRDSDIYSVDDLIGKNVSIGATESGTELNAKQILESNGLSFGIVNTVNLDYTDEAKQLAEGKIDAFFCTAGLATTMIGELTKEYDIRIISLDDKCVAKLISAYPCYTKVTIPAGTYQGQTEDINTVGVQSVLLASDSLSNETVRELTSMLFDNIHELQYATPLDLHISLNSATDGIAIPFHPGAAEYYAQQGITVATE